MFIHLDIQCSNLTKPSNGEIVSCNSASIGVGYEGDTCSFTCNTGYELSGNDTRTCQSDGSWSGSEIMCERGIYYMLYCSALVNMLLYSIHNEQYA